MRLNVSTGLPFGLNIKDVEVPAALRTKISTGIDYFDSAMGGKGFTPSVVTLFTGTPGAGKTTMMLALANSLTGNGATVVFNTGEESLYQVKMVTERLHLRHGFLAGGEVHVPTLLKQCDAVRARNPGKPFFLIVDSLQTMDDGKYRRKDGTTTTNGGSATRALAMITDYCKENMVNAIIIGQVNKGGQMAGSNKLKHMVDAHLHLSVEEKDAELAGCRVLETQKNRFGGAGHAFFLRLNEHGFKEIARVSCA
jgi:DNA repair protein RadA/Sms